ncbi:MAG: hypothetical protein INR62_08820 [Rhodospirillales bacterium]|nr:hypothetical protein [Acetobacter sp.]
MKNSVDGGTDSTVVWEVMTEAVVSPGFVVVSMAVEEVIGSSVEEKEVMAAAQESTLVLAMRNMSSRLRCRHVPVELDMVPPMRR